MPFWSKRGRVEKVIESVAAFSTFEAVSLPLPEWRSRWLPGLDRDNLLVGLNWSGAAATGYDVDAGLVEERLALLLRE